MPCGSTKSLQNCMESTTEGRGYVCDVFLSQRNKVSLLHFHTSELDRNNCILVPEKMYSLLSLIILSNPKLNTRYFKSALLGKVWTMSTSFLYDSLDGVFHQNNFLSNMCKDCHPISLECHVQLTTFSEFFYCAVRLIALMEAMTRVLWVFFFFPLSYSR